MIDGDDKQLFDGSRQMTRVEFLKIMMRSHCIEYRAEDTSDIEFVDTDKSTWQAKVIKKALVLNIDSLKASVRGGEAQNTFRLSSSEHVTDEFFSLPDTPGPLGGMAGARL